MAECMIPMIVLGPKIKFEPAFELVGIRFEGVLAEGQPLDILITAKAKTPVKEEVLFQLQVEAGLDDIQPRKEVFTGTEHEYRVRWTPKVDNPTAGRTSARKVVKQVTAIASYRWKNRTRADDAFTARSRSNWTPPAFAAAWTASSTASWAWSPQGCGNNG